MTRWFCDVCRGEIAKPDTQPVLRGFVSGDAGASEIHIKITRSIDGGWNSGDLCLRCLRRAFLAGVADALDETEVSA